MYKVQLIAVATGLALAITLYGWNAKRAPSPTPTPSQPISQSTTPPLTGPDLVLSQAHQYMQTENPRGAAALLIPLVGQFPDLASGWTLLSQAYAEMGSFKAAHLMGERAVALVPDDAAARFHTGAASAKSANRERSTQHLERAVALNPAQIGPIYLLAKLYESSFQPAEARSAYNDAATRFPADPDLRRAKAAYETDLTMDGMPNRIRITPTMVTVTDNASGVVLEVAGEWRSARVVDIGGPGPALITVNPTWLAVHTISQGKLIEAGRIPSNTAIYSQVDQAIVVTQDSAGYGQVSHYQLDPVDPGQLLVAKQFVDSGDPIFPPVDLVDLAARVVTMNPVAFAGPDLRTELQKRLSRSTPLEIRAPFLMVRPDGTFWIEIFEDGQITEQATVEVKGHRVSKLEWEP